jgi:prevent-host-death family protein
MVSEVRVPYAGRITMKTITVTELRGNIYNLLDEVLSTGIPLEINKGGKKLKIIPVGKSKKLQNLVSRPNVIKGNPDDLVSISWEKHETFRPI